jgi:hypothetical protein
MPRTPRITPFRTIERAVIGSTSGGETDRDHNDEVDSKDDHEIHMPGARAARGGVRRGGLGRVRGPTVPVRGLPRPSRTRPTLSAMPVGKPPDELFVLNGAFRVSAEADGNKVLELPGNPLDSFGVLFGPEDQQATEVSARIAGTNAGRMFPEFGVGANDAGGWKLWVLPGRTRWCCGRRRPTRSPGCRSSGERPMDAPEAPRVAGRRRDVAGAGQGVAGRRPGAGGSGRSPATDAAAPPKGRASVWGHPYAGTPIRFDDLAAAPAAAAAK